MGRLWWDFGTFAGESIERKIGASLVEANAMHTIHMLWQSSGISVIVLKNAWQSFYAWASKVPD